MLQTLDYLTHTHKRIASVCVYRYYYLRGAKLLLIQLFVCTCTLCDCRRSSAQSFEDAYCPFQHKAHTHLASQHYTQQPLQFGTGAQTEGVIRFCLVLSAAINEFNGP